MKKILLGIICGIFILSFASAWNFPSDSTVKYVNATYNNVTGTYDDTWINGTIDSKILTNNNSVNNRIASLYLINGTNGLNGLNGTNGTNGINGINGTNGTNGINGINGTNGLSGINGTNGTNGNNGINGLNGTNGTNGINGLNGTNGINGLNGTNGTDSINNTNWNNNYSVFLTHATTTYVDNQNTSQTNWVNNIFLKISDLIDKVGNWSADKVNYPTLAILNNGSYLNPSTSDTFIANYSTFLNKINWGDVGNGTIALMSVLNNGSYLNYPWNATNTSYLTSTGNIGNWTADKSTYTLLSVLNNGSYLNVATTDTFINNYSTFLTHITWANVMNGTLFQTSQWNSTNSTYNTWAYNQTIPANTYADSLLITTFYNASAINTVTGNPQGAIGNIQTYDSVSYNVSEVLSDLDLRVNFTGITTFNQIIVRYKSDTSESHTMDISLWDSSINGWESYRTVGVSPGYNIMTMNVYDIDDHIVGGVVQLRFSSTNVGGLTNKHQFDWVAISKGVATPSSSETDPYWTSEKENYYNTTQVDDMNTSNNNYIVDANTTLLQILNNGSYLNTASTDTFIANYSTFLTHLDWSKITNGSIWSWVMNGTIAKSSELNNGSYLNYAWNSTNTSYYLDSNPKGFYNSTFNIGNWTADKSSYTLLSILNNGSYLNPATSDTFIANYSTFLTHIDFGKVSNGTIWSWVMNGTLFKTSQWNATNTSYVSVDILNNGSYLNIAETDSKAYNGTLIDNARLNNGTYVITNILNNGSYLNYPWNATNTSYVSIDILNNGSYLNVAETDSKAYNGTLVDLGRLNNGTYVISSILNNGSYLNPATTDTFIANYSAFLTHITWANVMNGTLAKSSELNNGTYVISSVLNNGSYLNVAETDSKAYNGTLIDNARLNNGTYVTNLVLNNGSYLNVAETDSKAYNGTLALQSVLMNGSFFNPSTTDTFIANYSTFLTHTANNDSLKNYIDNTFNTTRNNEVTRQNTSIINWITNTFNTTRNNYITSVNTTLLQIINNGSYFNPSASDTFIANYSTFLTHIDFGKVSNGTIWSWVMNGTLFKTSQWNSTNTSYITWAESVNSTSEPKWNANYSLVRTLANLSFTGGNANFTTGNISAYGRIQLAVSSCGGMVSGEICRNATGVFIKG